MLSCESYGPFLGQSFQLAERPRIIALSLFILSLLLSSEPLIGCWSCDVNPESCDVVDSLYSVCSFAILFKTPFFKFISSPSLTLPKKFHIKILNSVRVQKSPGIRGLLRIYPTVLGPCPILMIVG